MRSGERKYRKCIYGASILILLFMFLRYVSGHLGKELYLSGLV